MLEQAEGSRQRGEHIMHNKITERWKEMGQPQAKFLCFLSRDRWCWQWQPQVRNQTTKAGIGVYCWLCLRGQ